MSQDSCCNRSRRAFLKGSGLALAGVGLTSLFPSPLIKHAFAAGPYNGRRLLFIYLDGGCDVLNTVIPHGDPNYNTTIRPSLFIPRAGSVDLNGFASLHPKLVDLQPSWQAGDLAVVHRLGYPNISQSHFDGYKILQGGDPANIAIFDGWLHRYAVENAIAQGARLPVVTANYLQPKVVQGQSGFVNIDNPEDFGYVMGETLTQKYRNSWNAHYTRVSGLEAYRAVLSNTAVKLADVLDEYATWDITSWNPRHPNTGHSLFPVDDATNPPDATGPNGKKFSADSYYFFKNLKLVALALLESDATSANATRVAGIELGGFDTHDGQGGSSGAHPELMSWLGYGLESLRLVFTRSATDPRVYPAIWNETCVVTFTEFGRTTRENGSAGTDHGQAAFSFVMGGNVNGGIHNCDPGSWEPDAIFAVDGEYLSHRTDFRALFWEILRDHMGASVSSRETIFPGYGAAGLTELNLFS